MTKQEYDQLVDLAQTDADLDAIQAQYDAEKAQEEPGLWSKIKDVIVPTSTVARPEMAGVLSPEEETAGVTPKNVVKGLATGVPVAAGLIPGLGIASGIGLPAGTAAVGALASQAAEGKIDPKQLGIETGITTGLSVLPYGLVPAAKLAKKIYPTVAQTITGIKAPITKTLLENYPEVTNTAKISYDELIKQPLGKLNTQIKTMIKEAGQRIGQAVGDAPIDVEQARKPLEDFVTKTMSNKQASPAMIEQAKAADEILKRHFYTVDGTPLQAITPSHAISLESDIKQLGDMLHYQGIGVKGTSQGTTVASRELQTAVRDTAGGISKAIQTTFEDLPEVRKQYAALKTLERDISPSFSTVSRTEKTMRNVSGPDKELLNAYLDKIAKAGYDIRPDAQKIEAMSIFNKAPLSPISRGGATSTTFTVPAQEVAAQAGEFVGGSIGRGLGRITGNIAASPFAVKQGARAILAAEKGGIPNIPLSLYELLKDKQENPQ